MHPEPILLALNGILGVAAFVSALTGFGYALIATPFLVLLMAPAAAVPIVLISWFPVAFVLIVECVRLMTFRRILHLLIFALLGLPVGVHGLATLPAEVMRTVIGATTLLAAVSLLVHPGKRLRSEGWALSGAGLLSGVIGGGSGMTGPPVVLLGLKQGWDHRGFRADLIGYFSLLHTCMIVVFGHIGLVDATTLRLAGWSLPGVAAGSALGLWLKQWVDGTAYRRLAMGLVVAGGLLATALR